ncbi:hypothetical protein [Glutamicibacter sp.]|uniref:hypothetical protein n=1 Tax=Glutamicibacter sp. TaxID=1931995 RepID=UPI003FA611B3
MRRASTWISERTTGSLLATVEGTRSYAATTTHALIENGITVMEAKPRERENVPELGRPMRSTRPQRPGASCITM